jgi:glycosyltransferase involved in cell wall biosynthesis
LEKKHLHICHSLSFGGITSFVKALANLNTDSNANHHILIWQKGSSDSHVIDISNSEHQTKALNAALEKYDLIFVHSLKPSFIPKLFKHRERVYLFQHGMTFGSGFRKFYKTLKYFIVANILKFNIVCSSEFAKNKLKRQIYYLNDRFIKIIPFGIDMEHRASITRTELTLTVGFAGRLVPQKRIDKLLDSISSRDCNGPINCKIAGTGQLLEALKEQAEKLPNDEVEVNFLSELDNMADFYNNIDIFVLPSVGESYGLVVLEALHYNVPVIVFEDTGACVDFVIDGKNGFVVKNNRELSERLCQFQSKELREKFKWNIQQMDLKKYHISNTKALLDDL